MTFKELNETQEWAQIFNDDWQKTAARIVISRGYWALIEPVAKPEDVAASKDIICCLEKYWIATQHAIVDVLNLKIEEKTETAFILRDRAIGVGQLAMEHLKVFDSLIKEYKNKQIDESWRCPHPHLVEAAEKTLDDLEEKHEGN